MLLTWRVVGISNYCWQTPWAAPKPLTQLTSTNTSCAFPPCTPAWDQITSRLQSPQPPGLVDNGLTFVYACARPWGSIPTGRGKNKVCCLLGFTTQTTQVTLWNVRLSLEVLRLDWWRLRAGHMHTSWACDFTEWCSGFLSVFLALLC